MKRIFGVILNYFQNDILKTRELIQDKSIELSKIDEMLTMINSRNIENEKISTEMSKYIKSDIFNLRKFIEALSILNKYENTVLSHLPQVKNSLDYLNNITEFLNNRKESLSKEIEKYNISYIDKRSRYFSYLNCFDEYGLKKDLPKKTLEDLIRFLDNSDLDREIVAEFKNICAINYDRFNPIVNNVDDGLIMHATKPEIENKEKEEIKEDKENIINDELMLTKDEILKIEDFISQYDGLGEHDKKIMESAYFLLKDKNAEYITSLSPNYNANEITCYAYISNLKRKYESYKLKIREYSQDINDEMLKQVINEELSELKEEINDNLSNIEKLVSIIEEEDSMEVLNNSKEVNLVLFLDINHFDTDGNRKVSSIYDIDTENLYKKDGGKADSEIVQINRLIDNYLVNMTAPSLRTLGKDVNKPLFNLHNNEYPYFDKEHFNARVCKGRFNNPARVTYISLPLSENNKKELKEKYNLFDNGNVYLVIGMFSKLSDDDEYASITHARLRDEYVNIKRLERIFSMDFTLETRKQAFALIDNGYELLNNLKNNQRGVSR